MLNEALATEIVCVLRYRRHYFMASGIHAAPVAAEFLAHATEEMGDAPDLIAERIIQLRGEPNFSPDGLAARSHAEYVEGVTLRDMIKENLIAERVAIESYPRNDPVISASRTRRRAACSKASSRARKSTPRT